MTPPAILVSQPPHDIVYPESDGLPMAENTVQFEWIVKLYINLVAMFADRLDVFVCGNQFWYPREGDPSENQSPDVYVVFGRPKGRRPSYKQWVEDGVPMTVVFEILSPSNDPLEMARKLTFYDEYGVEEYYVFDPLQNTLQVYHRGRQALCLLSQQAVYTSPRLGIRFDLTGEEMVVYYPDGRPFLSPEALDAERRQQEQLRQAAERAAERAQRDVEEGIRDAKQAKLRAEQAQQDAEQAQRKVEQANTRADQAQREVEQANTRAEQAQRDIEQARTLAEQAQRDTEQAQRDRKQAMTALQRALELSRKARLQQATPEELEELNRLEASDPVNPKGA